MLEKYWLNRLLVGVLVLSAILGTDAQDSIPNQVVFFQKSELNSGLVFDYNRDRYERFGDNSYYLEKNSPVNIKYRFELNQWNYLDFKQEFLQLALETGFFAANGEITDSTEQAFLSADDERLGWKIAARARYNYRFYYDARNYSLLDLTAWGNYGIFCQKLNGKLDTTGTGMFFSEKSTKDRLRLGIKGRAAYGVGRLGPMNHLMVAHYLLEKYYPGRLFSDEEIAWFAAEIARLKAERSLKQSCDEASEVQALEDFLRSKYLLTAPAGLEVDWQHGEFVPRNQGVRFEMGPHFQYLNYDPDFIYGAFMSYEQAQYLNVNWNRQLSGELIYNRYSATVLEQVDETLANRTFTRDWLSANLSFSWSYFPNLRSRFDFGMRYLPGVNLTDFDRLSNVSHNFVPFMALYHQLNRRTRLKFNLAWRIGDGEEFLLPGPEFSLSLYRSRY